MHQTRPLWVYLDILSSGSSKHQTKFLSEFLGVPSSLSQYVKITRADRSLATLGCFGALVFL